MNATVGHWANLPSHGCFAYLAADPEPAVVEALVAAIVDGLGAGDLQLSAKRGKLAWSAFSATRLAAALAGDAPSLSLLAGTPRDVHLAARLPLRTPRDDGRTLAPPVLWLAAEGTRWPSARFAEVARAWFRIVATRATPLSGGAFAASDMRNAKVEASLEYESFEGERPDPAYAQLRKEPPVVHAWDKLRRFYPITLLGPAFLARTDAEALRAAGAHAIEPVGAAAIVDTMPALVATWSKPYLDATARLRALAWPWLFQHPLDKPRG